MSHQPEQIKVTYHIDPAAERGIYSNSATIFHNETEFLFDFGFSLPGPTPTVKVFSRIITSPQHAQRLLQALAENIRKYEEKFGMIKELGSRSSTNEIVN
ncbi:DUF3467 domain-containing protein [bacterium]|nr:DUF3467 domain-containing protein [bacterium]